MPVRLLDKHVAELIAAGEVVERPASVVKELVENAVDAGAAVITVEIQNGGITYLRVTDDGCGIPFDEVPVAFLRHATSKVATEEDLTRIGTLGFRGEALPSIAAVARVDLLTSTGKGSGTAYSIEGGIEVSHAEAGCPKGTTVVVRDLFFNTPARMKFLKKDVSEGNAVAAVMDRMALSHPEIAFRFLRDGKQAMATSGKGGIEAAVYAVYGREFANGLIPLDYDAGAYRLTGLVSRPADARKSRSMQHFFLNGRYVKSNTMMAALEQACKGSVMVGRFPACVLNLAMPCDEVDINVHPAKLECRFTDEKRVFDVVYYGVKNALQLGDTRPEITLKSEPFRTPETTAPAPVQPAFSQAAYQPPQAPPPPPKPAPRRDFLDVFVDEEPAPLKVAEPAPAYQPRTEAAPPVKEEPLVTETPEVPLRLIGEAFCTYVFVEQGEDVLIIDKHAAHERILYEEMKAGRRADAQFLLEPVAVTLAKEEYGALQEHTKEIADVGFELEEFGEGCVLVRAVPAVLEGEDPRSLVEEIAAGFLKQKNAVEIDALDWLYHNMACRAAVKGGDRSGEDLTALAKRVAAFDDVRYCPHGRPVAYRLSRAELEKQFGRQG